jgi:hypothetical protein
MLGSGAGAGALPVFQPAWAPGRRRAPFHHAPTRDLSEAGVPLDRSEKSERRLAGPAMAKRQALDEEFMDAKRAGEAASTQCLDAAHS